MTSEMQDKFEQGPGKDMDLTWNYLYQRYHNADTEVAYEKYAEAYYEARRQEEQAKWASTYFTTGSVFPAQAVNMLKKSYTVDLNLLKEYIVTYGEPVKVADDFPEVVVENKAADVLKAALQQKHQEEKKVYPGIKAKIARYF